jgi:kinase-associated protein B
MSVQDFNVGDRVKASYKTGEYIGEIAEPSTGSKVAVRILAVVQHPMQGDLHNPNDASVAFFHQRRALSNQEIALMPLSTVSPYTGNVPDYVDSLKRALKAQQDELSNMEQWAKRSLNELEQLHKEYFPNNA